jgi:hypothetical protein
MRGSCRRLAEHRVAQRDVLGLSPGLCEQHLSALARNYGDVFWDYIASVVGGEHAADVRRVPVRVRHRNYVEAY